MSIRPLAAAVTAVLVFAGTAGAQAILGTYTSTNQQGGQVTLVLSAAAGGKLAGSLSGNGNAFQLEGVVNGEAGEGTISGNGMKMFFVAQMKGSDLNFIMVEPDANGQPNFQRASQIPFKRGGSAPAASGNASGGNPLGAGARGASTDRYAGAWASKDVQLTLSGGSGKYSGTLVHQGQSYPVTLKDEGPGLSGTFTAGGSSYELLIKLENSFLHLNTAGTTYMLARGNAGGANPLGGGGGAQSANTGGARSPQDEQMFRVLTANGWCSFSYSGSSGTYSSGGVTRTSKVFLRPDGTVSGTSNSERTSSGDAGQAYVGGSSGAQGFWKYENGTLYLGPSPQQLAPQQFKMTYNSNGYPIPVVNGTEYMICR